MISPALRDRIGHQLDRMKTTPVQIQRASSTRDAKGNIIETWPTIATVLGSVGKDDRAKPSERVQADQPTAASTFLIKLPAGTDVRNTDRLVALGLTYSIIGIDGPLTLELESRCQCELVG